MKIVSIIGVRPEFIQCTTLLRELRKQHRIVIVHTGQHYDYDMYRVFFDELEIPRPDYHLGVGSSTHAYQTGEMLRRIEEVLIKERPDLVLVHGDTNSTLAGALSAAKLQIKVGHVEAGMRSFDRSMPEEINRVLTDRCSDYLFCSTETAIDNLERENITKDVYLTGDVMADTLSNYKEVAERSRILDELGLESKRYLVATIHRASNTDNRHNMENIVNTFCKLDETMVFPLHPRTEKYLKDYGLYDRLREKVKLTKPLGYIEFLKLLNHAKKVLTDSGGIQKEAYMLKVPCITLRNNTEWVETLQGGWNVLAGTNEKDILQSVKNSTPLGNQAAVFGEGASKMIAEIVYKIDKNRMEPDPCIPPKDLWRVER